jgi:hypothetical protein
MKFNLGKNKKFLLSVLVIAITYCTNVNAEKFCKWQGCVPMIVEKNSLGQMKIDKINENHSNENKVNDYGKKDIDKMLQECKVWKGFWPANCPIRLENPESSDYNWKKVREIAQADLLAKSLAKSIISDLPLDNHVTYLWTDSLLAGLDYIKAQTCSIPKLSYTDLDKINDCAKNIEKWSASDYKFLDPNPEKLKLFFGARGWRFNFWETVECKEKLRLVEKPWWINQRKEAAKAWPSQTWINHGTFKGPNEMEETNWEMPKIMGIAKKNVTTRDVLRFDPGIQENLYISISLLKAAYSRKKSGMLC